MSVLKNYQHGICITEEIKAAATGLYPCDVLLVCAANEKLLAHKLILAAASPLLKTILEDASISSDTITTIHFPDISAHFCRMLLNFLYSGEISLLSSEVVKMNNFLLLLQMCDLKKFDISINDSSKAENSITLLNAQQPHVKLERLNNDHIPMNFYNPMDSSDSKSSGTQILNESLSFPIDPSTNVQDLILERLHDDHTQMDENNEMNSDDIKVSETSILKGLLLMPVNVSTNDKL